MLTTAVLDRTLGRCLRFRGALVVVSVVLFSMCAKTDLSSSLHKIVPSEVFGWKMQDTAQTYDAESIFDYINGAGEVYRSFNLRTVAVFRYANPDEPGITVELFDMGSTEDAYGVFSHAREETLTGIGQEYQYRPGLLCFWQANYFACVSSEKETPGAKEAIFALARDIDQRLPQSGATPQPVECLPEEGLISQSVRFFHTHAMLNYHYFMSDRNILNLDQHTRAVLARYAPGSTYLLCVQYPSVEQAKAGHDSFIKYYVPQADAGGVLQVAPGKWVAVNLVREYVVIAFDAPIREYASRLTRALADRL